MRKKESSIAWEAQKKDFIREGILRASTQQNVW